MNLMIPNKLVTPSYAMGYARSQSESAEPGLWDGLATARMPMLGMTGEELFDATGRSGVGDSGVNDVNLAWGLNEFGPCIIRTGLTNACNFPAPSIQTLKNTIIWYGKITGGHHYGRLWCDGNRNHSLLPESSGSNNVTIHYVSASNTTFDIGSRLYDHESIIFIRDGTEVRLYLEGVLSGSAAFSSLSSPLNGNIFIQDNYTGTRNVNGGCNVFMIYDRVLTPAEIMQLANDPLAPFRRKDQPLFLPPVVSGGGIIGPQFDRYRIPLDITNGY